MKITPIVVYQATIRYPACKSSCIELEERRKVVKEYGRDWNTTYEHAQNLLKGGVYDYRQIKEMIEMSSHTAIVFYDDRIYLTESNTPVQFGKTKRLPSVKLLNKIRCVMTEDGKIFTITTEQHCCEVEIWDGKSDTHDVYNKDVVVVDKRIGYILKPNSGQYPNQCCPIKMIG